MIEYLVIVLFTPQKLLVSREKLGPPIPSTTAPANSGTPMKDSTSLSPFTASTTLKIRPHTSGSAVGKTRPEETPGPYLESSSSPSLASLFAFWLFYLPFTPFALKCTIVNRPKSPKNDL